MALFCAPSLLQGQDQSTQDIWVLPISDDETFMVDAVQADFVKRVIKQAQEQGAQQIILMMDTFGGEVFQAREISEALLNCSIPVTTYVQKKAISAGAFIAYSTDKIVMQKFTSIGDAQAIMQTPEGIEEAPEKLKTVFRSDFADKAAGSKGHSRALAIGFMEVEAEILWVETDGNMQVMTRRDHDALSDDEKEDHVIKEVISPKGELLTLTAALAHKYGLIGPPAENFDSFLESQNISKDQVRYLEMTEREQWLRHLGANAWLTGLLIIIGLTALYKEVKVPGFGIAGLTAVLCFAIVFGLKMMIGTATNFELFLFGVGILLCVAEIFVIPGFGVAGISGLVLIILSILLAQLPEFSWEHPHIDERLLNQAFTVTSLAVVGGVLSLLALIATIPKWASRSPLVHQGDLAEAHSVPSEDSLIGQEGKALTDLMPGGHAMINGQRHSVVSSGSFIAQGTAVKVIEQDGPSIKVSAV